MVTEEAQDQKTFKTRIKIITNLNVYLVLDQSGSMQNQWIEAIGSVNGYVEELRKSDVVGARVSLVSFDSVTPYNVVRDKVAVSDFIPITTTEIYPRGGTPLYDTVGLVLAEANKVNAEKTVIAIMTDGQENGSKEFNVLAIKAAIKQAEAKGWEVLFLGANFDVKTYADSFGLHASKFINTSDGTRGAVFRGMAQSSAMYASGAVMEFTDAQKAAAQ